MQTYDSYLERVFALPFEDAARIFATIKKQIENDDDMTDLYHDLLSRSIEYSSVRAEWQMMTTEEKGAIDSRRSEIHDAVIREFDILARNLKLLNVHAYRFDGYVARVSDMKSYFDENMRLLQEGSMDALFGPAPIYTKIRDDNPTRYLEGSSVKNSLLADGCVIEGSVENSVLFRGCKIKKGAVVKNCVLMQDTVVEPNCNVEYVVTDKNVHITEDKKLTGTDTFPVFVAKGHSV